MSKFLSEVKGFTPVIDVLAKEMGLMTAVVYGIVWRYCQMEDKKCTASRERIAKHAEISSKTVERHLKKLCDHGYLKDLTPTWKHRPHEYADTGKAKIKGLLTAEVGETESPTSESGETESPTSESGETESPTRSDRESEQGKTESLIRIPSYDSIHDSQLGEKETPVSPKKSNEPTDSVVEHIIIQTETHPGPLEVAARTAEARAGAGGNYAVPPSAGGDDALAAFGLFCLYDKRDKAAPKQGTKEYRQQCEKVRESLRAYEYQQCRPEIVEKAAELFCERKGTWVNVFYRSFVADFGIALQDAEYFIKHGHLPDDDKKGTRHGSHQHIAKGAAPRRVATEDEARAILGDRYGGP